MTYVKTTVLGTILATVLATSAFATDYTTLRNDKRMHGELLGASLAYLISENCPSIKLRRLTMIGRALRLRSYAKGLGYSGDEVDSYVTADSEKARFRSIAEPILVKKGAVPGKPETYCAVGKKEIASKTFVGTLLRAR